MANTVSYSIQGMLSIFDNLFATYIDDIDLSQIMVYMVDAVDAAALPYLAKQFNVDGIRGWNLATTESQQRELIKNAIQIQKKEGTPWSIKNALKQIGYSNVTITEGVGIANYYDGINIHDGTITYSGSGGTNHWVNFNVTIKVEDSTAITDEQKALIKLLINEYKPERCILIELTIENE